MLNLNYGFSQAGNSPASGENAQPNTDRPDNVLALVEAPVEPLVC